MSTATPQHTDHTIDGEPIPTLDDIASRPEGSVPVEFTLIVVPRKSTTEGN